MRDWFLHPARAGPAVLLIAHGRGESAVDQVPNAGVLAISLRIAGGLDRFVERRAVGHGVWISGHVVPVVRLGVAQAADRHRRAQLELRAVGPVALGRLDVPHQLIGQAVGVTADAGEGARRRRLGGVEHRSAELAPRVGGVIELERARDGHVRR